MNRLQFFVHDDPDAVLVELAGSLRDVETVHHAWQRAALADVLKPVIVDITFITEADEHAQPIVIQPIETDDSKHGSIV